MGFGLLVGFCGDFMDLGITLDEVDVKVGQPKTRLWPWVAAELVSLEWPHSGKGAEPAAIGPCHQGQFSLACVS